MLRRAVQGDLAQLIKLRCAGSKDTPAQAAAWLQDIAGFENLLLVEQGTPPALTAMLAAVPVTSGARSGLWLCGMHTRADRQGRGLMSRLLAAAFRAWGESGYDFIVTVPPDARARAWLEKSGFSDAFPLRRVEKSIPRNLYAQAEFDTMTVRRLSEARQRWQPGGVILPEQTLAGILTRLYNRGATLVSGEHGYGIFYTADPLLYFIELQADNDYSADTLLQAAREHTGLETADILLAEPQTLYPGLGRRCRYGMVRFLKEPFSVTDVYFRVLL